MKKVSDFIIYSNLLISLCAAALIWETYLLLNVSVNLISVAVGFAATLLIYNTDRLVVLEALEKNGNERHSWILKFRLLLILLSIVSLIFLVTAVFFMPLRCLIFLLHLGLISLLYSIPLLFRGKKNLRSIKLLKIFLIMYVWAATTVMLPAIWSGYDIWNRDVLLLFLERALFIFAITLPFDIRDYTSDKLNHVITIPAIIGIRQTRLLAYACLLVFFLINILHYSYQEGILWAKLVSGLYAMLLIAYTDEKKHEYYFTGLIDSSMLVQFLLVLVLQ